MAETLVPGPAAPAPNPGLKKCTLYTLRGEPGEPDIRTLKQNLREPTL